MTPWITRLLIANGAMFLLSMTFPQIVPMLWLVPAQAIVRPWTLITYMFLHGGLWHIFFNMLALFFFGPRLEERLGGKHFLLLYFASGIMGGVLSFFFTPTASIVGASGAVFGVLLGFARYWPHERIYIWGILPIEARTLVIIMTLISLWSGFSGAGGGVAHFAHLGGFLGGFLFLKWFEKNSPAARFRTKAAPPHGGRLSDTVSLQKWKQIRREKLHEVNQGELDRILDKISADGVQSLNSDERGFLERFSSY